MKRSCCSVDKLNCKKDVILALLNGMAYSDIAEMIKSKGEECSRSAIHRYAKNRLVSVSVEENGSIKIKERDREFLKCITYECNSNVGVVTGLIKE